MSKYDKNFFGEERETESKSVKENGTEIKIKSNGEIN